MAKRHSSKSRSREEFGVRPLTGLALKSIIDTLRQDIPNARVLDLFAGTGVFSEACRELGAREICLVEKSPTLASCLRLIGSVENCDVFDFLKGAGKYNIIFADPPYPMWNESFSRELALGVAPKLALGGIFLVRRPKRVLFSLEISGLKATKVRDLGEMQLIYLRNS